VSEFETTTKDLVIDTVLRALARRLPRSQRRLLDVGAHVGRLISRAASAGWRAEGLELNPVTASYAAKRTGLPVEQRGVEYLRRDARTYSAITMIDVLEHIPNPVPVLQNLNTLLEPGGWLAVKVPCGPSQVVKERLRVRLRPGYKFDPSQNLVHVSLFSPRALRVALKRAGFTNLHLTIGAPELALTQTHGARAHLSNAFRRAVYLMARGLPGGVNTPLAMNLQVYAQKA
jgi:SAM-dependent methyltransferase